MAGRRRQYSRSPYRVIYAGVEGDSEKAFLKWLEKICDENGVLVRFKIQNCCGGSPRQVFDDALKYRPSRTQKKNALILMDKDILSDHEERELMQLAEKNNITLIIQRPSFEGILLRLNPGEETKGPPPEAVKSLLRKFWKDYEKPPAAKELGSRYGLNNLNSLAKSDEDLARLMALIGL